MATQIYRPLSREGDFRILRLKPGDFQDEIEGELILAAVKDFEFNFNAMSYAWGDGNPDISISINNSTFKIRNNLSMALRRVRLESDYTMIWVDAICINQNDFEERSRQVGIMRQIYKSALRVMIYIGEVTEGTQEALLRILQMSKMSKESEPNLLILPRLAHEWKYFQDFYSRSWFKRLWVLQEVAVSTNDPIVICGKYSIPWKHIREAARFFYKSGSVRTTRRLDIAFNVNLMGDCKDNPNAYSLLSLLRRTVLFEATDPKDRLFALYGLAHDIESSWDRSIFRIDYSDSTSVENLYRQFSRDYIGVSGKSDILTMESGDTRLGSLPSWVPDLSSPAKNSTLGTSSFEDSRYLFLEPGCAFRFPFASDGYQASEWHYAHLADSDDPNVLRIGGSIADKVEWVSEPFNGDLIEHLPAARKPGYLVTLWNKVLQLLKYTTNFENLQECFWRTLIANVAGSVGPAPDSFYTHFLCFWREKRFLDREAERWAAVNPNTPSINDPDVYGTLQRKHTATRKFPKQFSEGLQRLWPIVREKHSNGCQGCGLCGINLHKIPEALVLNRRQQTGQNDPMLEFEDSDCFIKEYFRRLRLDIMEPLPIIQGSEMLFCTANIQAMQNRSFFITEKGRMGIGPRSIRPSDLVTIISGASMPLILRKIETHYISNPYIDGENGTSTRYIVVGPTYTHGLMSGEGVPIPIIRNVPDQEIPGVNDILAPARARLYSLLGLNFANGKRVQYTYPWDIFDLV